MSGTLGGQIRVNMCPCGWSCRAQLREANAKMKMHTKYCEEWKNDVYRSIPFIKNFKGAEEMGNGNLKQINKTNLFIKPKKS